MTSTIAILLAVVGAASPAFAQTPEGPRPAHLGPTEPTDEPDETEDPAGDERDAGDEGPSAVLSIGGGMQFEGSLRRTPLDDGVYLGGPHIALEMATPEYLTAGVSLDLDFRDV